MISRIPLSLQILLFAFLNLLLLALGFLVFARLAFRFDLSSFMLASARERVVSVSRLVALELPDTPRKEWNQLLARYSNTYPAEFYLFDENGTQLAGRAVTLPTEMARAIKRDPFAHAQRKRGGPPRFLGRFSEPPPPENSGGRPRPMPEVDGPGGPPPGEEPGPRHFRTRLGGPGQPPLELTRTSSPTQYWMSVHVPVWSGPSQEPIHAALVWRVHSLWTQRFFFDYRPWLLSILAIVTISILCWTPFIRGLLRSISQVTAATGQIADGHFEIKLPTRRRDELGKLSESISRMAQRLAGLVHGQRRFLSDIAHELCSPIARTQVAIGILEQRAAEDQEEYVSSVREEVEHMSGLVNELLEFSKSQSRSKTTPLCSVNLADTIRKVIDREGSEAAGLAASVDETVEVIANPEYLARAIANVVRNAIRYAGGNGPIEISASRSQESVVMTVADNGPGIPENELENVFRPFYRPELARQRETGGVGLGLAIVRSSIEACNGSVSCRNREPKGLIVEIRLTAAPARKPVYQESLA